MKTLKISIMLTTILLLALTACRPQSTETPEPVDPGVQEPYPAPDEETVPEIDPEDEPVAYPGPDDDPDTPQDPGKEAGPVSDIIGITWQWERYEDNADLNNITVEEPGLYTLTLNPDGTYHLKADCNLANGGYTLDGSQLQLLPGPTTLAECGPDSLYNTFLVDLGNVRTYVMADGKLVLNLWADAGNMVFAPAP